MLVFQPCTIVQGIVYHLLDEKIVTAVSPESLEEAVRKLSEQHQSLAISKPRWQAMANRQRLEWLVKHARITVEGHIDGTATLVV